MYQSSARPPPSAVCILIKRAALIPASQHHHNRVVSCPGSAASLGPRFSHQNQKYFSVRLCKFVLQSSCQKLPSSIHPIQDDDWKNDYPSTVHVYKNTFKTILNYLQVNRNMRPVSQVPAQIIITRPTKMLAVCGAAVRGLNQHDFIRQLTNHSPGLASCDLSDQSGSSI